MTFPSAPCCFRYKIPIISISVYLRLCSRLFFLSFFFRSSICQAISRHEFWVFILFLIHSTTWIYRFMPFFSFGKFLAIISKKTFIVLFSLSSFSWTFIIQMSTLLLSLNPWNYSFFKPYFYFQFILDIFSCWSSSSLVLCSVFSNYVIVAIQSVFCCRDFIFKFLISIWFFLPISIHLLSFSIFIIISKELVTSSWIIFMLTIFKSLSNDSNIWFILKLMSVVCFILFKLWISWYNHLQLIFIQVILNIILWVSGS